MPEINYFWDEIEDNVIEEYAYVNQDPINQIDPSGLIGSINCPSSLTGGLDPWTGTRVCPRPKCGTDITAQLLAFQRNFRHAFTSAPYGTRVRACEHIDSLTMRGWDIVALAHEKDRFTDAASKCGLLGRCWGTAMVKGHCFRTDEINYFLWGMAARLCGDLIGVESSTDRYSLGWAVALVSLYRYCVWGGTGTEGRVAWTVAGYNGTLSVSARFSVDSTCDKCTTVYGGPLDGYIGVINYGVTWIYDDFNIDGYIMSQGTQPTGQDPPKRLPVRPPTQ